MAARITEQFSYQVPFSGEQPLPSKVEISEGTGITLLVRHLPEGIPHDMLLQLFSYYGASSCRPCSGGSLRNCAFVDFKDETSASLAQSQLNRLKFHRKVLSVERVRNSSSDKKHSHLHSSNEPSSRPVPQLEDSSSSVNAKSIPAMPATCSESIAPKLGVDYPFPPFLEYSYPPPDGNILTNIVNALIAVPRFYTQVLHLMNKMNIPAPFRMSLPTPPLPPPVPAPTPPPPPPNAEEPPPPDVSSEESELESSEEDVARAERRKRRKREVIIGPAIDKGIAHEDVGLKPTGLVPKEVPVIRKKNPILQIKITPKTAKTENKVDEKIMTSVTDTYKDDIEAKSFATPQEIETGRLPVEEILSLPKFKNYAAGNPNNVLYIKNLAKDVVVDDFYFVFGSLFGSLEAARVGLGIKLMQEGRMKDQAFVTFPSVNLAQQALDLANGYVFKSKPMVIQFGRKPDTTKTSERQPV